MVRIGVVGVGFMGMIHYLAAQKLKRARVAAICTRDRKKLAGDWRGIRGNFGPAGTIMDLGSIRRHADFEALLADPDIDLVKREREGGYVQRLGEQRRVGEPPERARRVRRHVGRHRAPREGGVDLVQFREHPRALEPRQLEIDEGDVDPVAVAPVRLDGHGPVGGGAPAPGNEVLRTDQLVAGKIQAHLVFRVQGPVS